MAQKKNKIRIFFIFLLFIAYFIIAARPIPRETILVPGWISSVSQNDTFQIKISGNISRQASIIRQVSGQLIPFTLGKHFGYIDISGQFAVNKVRTGNIYLGDNMWAEFDSEPDIIEINTIFGNISDTKIIENPKGYPVLLDNRVFILGNEQNMLSEIDVHGNTLWTYEFGAPLTCIDAAAGFVLTGSIDGIIEILDSQGRRIYYFEPGGSRYSIILGCAFSRDGLRLGIICGIDQQRFLLLERFGSSNEYKVIYNESLGAGFRRPVRITFIDDDQRVVFERPGGLGCYNIKSRQGLRIPLTGEIAAMDNSGDQGFFFLINSHSEQQKELIGIKFPQNRLIPFLSNFLTMGSKIHELHDTVFLRALFKSEDIFLSRMGSLLIAGGGDTLISFELEEK